MTVSSARRSTTRRFAFVPQLEGMESRDCPSCSVTFRDGMLSIVGDSSANQVAILNTWTGTQVRCDQQEPRTFVGVTAISVRTLEGDDHVSFVSATTEHPTHTPIVTVELGAWR